MKNVYSTLLFLFATTISFAQGISVQGIARNAAGSAMTNKSLTFTFIIADGNSAPIFLETQAITTDLFGVFSHIVGTGNTAGATFSSIDFSLDDLKLKISVAPDGNDIEIYNQPFQYTPYAHYAKRAASADNAINAANAVKADNGVPTGAIMPFAGQNAPDGWVLCHGQNIASVAGSQALRTLLGSQNAPSLRGRFLKGAGNPVESNVDEIILNKSQSQQTRLTQHKHSSGDLKNSGVGNHTHDDSQVNNTREVVVGGLADKKNVYYNKTTRNSGGGGAHNHVISGNTGDTNEASSKEIRPSSYGVNYIIKL
jgi:microcystin-dependent protein